PDQRGNRRWRRLLGRQSAGLRSLRFTFGRPRLANWFRRFGGLRAIQSEIDACPVVGPLPHATPLEGRPGSKLFEGHIRPHSDLFEDEITSALHRSLSGYEARYS